MASITHLLKLLNKPALLTWANKIGLNGVSLKEYRNKLTNEGTNKHKLVENYLLHGEIFPFYELLDEALNGYDIVGVEQDFDNGDLSGRIDLIIKNRYDDTITIVDFKSSSKVYLEQKLQLSAYKEMYGADNIAVISFKDWKLKFIDIDTKKYFNIVLYLNDINKTLAELNESL